ncbi:unnamed protein product [Caenorhabditis auriculariae]|uniref:Galectin n=1 Tax=Caenorhabditis auriculariae TaxID=2777116 RepID=A0A8S1HP67_9PELO|nr:unnamed protein product [Caenorhabditis auriculariae]
MVKLLTVLFLGLSPAAYGYVCNTVPDPVAGPHNDIPTRFVVLSRPLRVGDTVVINGKVVPDVQAKKRLSIDLLVGTKPVYYKTVSTLHFTAQYDLNQTSIGDYQPNKNQVFREEKVLPLAFTFDPFSLRVKVEADGYSIYVDKKFLYKLKYFKENYSTVQTLYFQNVDFHTECFIDCKEEKVCPNTGGGEKTFIVGQRVFREVDGTCPA